MVIKKNQHKKNVIPSHLNNQNYMKGRIGFWAIVKEVNSINNTVTVISDTGFEYPNVQVMSSEWVTVDDNKDYIPSERNLPPVNSRVFVLTPTYTAVGAFILCSGFSRGDENIRTLWAADENELEEKNNSREKITQGGWDIKEEYATGNLSAVSADGDISLTVCTTEDEEEEQEKEISFSAWGNIIKFNEDGISITDLNDNIFEITSAGIKVTDANNNVIETKDSGIKITDKNNNVAEMKSAGITVQDCNNNKIETNSSGVSINNHLTISLPTT